MINYHLSSFKNSLLISTKSLSRNLKSVNYLWNLVAPKELKSTNSGPNTNITSKILKRCTLRKICLRGMKFNSSNPSLLIYKSLGILHQQRQWDHTWRKNQNSNIGENYHTKSYLNNSQSIPSKKFRSLTSNQHSLTQKWRYSRSKTQNSHKTCIRNWTSKSNKFITRTSQDKNGLQSLRDALMISRAHLLQVAMAQIKDIPCTSMVQLLTGLQLKPEVTSTSLSITMILTSTTSSPSESL